jgi:peptidyl-tRNA hydrolase
VPGAKWARAVIGSGHTVLLAQPQTFMNVSGPAVGKGWLAKYELDAAKDLLVVL